jgi:L-ascorbate metabolism protein UlaG (beta-lactamase superfamily)
MGMRKVMIGLGCALLLLVSLLAYGLLVDTLPPVDPGWELAATDSAPAGAVTVRFSGTSTLLFSDGETDWMVDGWFSRPGPLRLLLGKIAPDIGAIEQGLAANGVESLAAVFAMHSHYDHALDAPEVARRTGAVLLGSASTANIARGWGLPESQIRVVQDRESIRLGQFVLTPIESRHFQFANAAMREKALDQTQIESPLVPPAKALDYRVGKAYVLHVEHPLGSWVIVGSAGYLEGSLDGLSADVVFLGLGGLGSQTAEYRASYWRETVSRLSPQRIIPIHYDSLTAPQEGPFRGQVAALALLEGGRETTLSYLREQGAQNPQLQFQTLPRFNRVLLFE